MALLTRAWALAAAAAALCSACERSEPAPISAPPSEAQSDAAVLADPTAPEVAGVPTLDPVEPPPDLALPPIPGESAPAPPPRPARAPRRSADVAAAVAEPVAEHSSLDALLRAPDLPRAEAKPLDLAPPPPAASQPKPAPGALDRLGQNIRLERRKEPIGIAGPRQGTLYETEAGLRIPVDSAISLEGGVRVDSREEPGVEEPDRRSTPTVGVEVRF